MKLHSKWPAEPIGPHALLTMTLEQRAQRQGKLLDEALLATYPASDPLSAFVVN